MKEQMIDFIIRRLADAIRVYADNREAGLAFIDYQRVLGYYYACCRMFSTANFPTFDELYAKALNNKDLVDPNLIDENFNFFGEMQLIKEDVYQKYVKGAIK